VDAPLIVGENVSPTEKPLANCGMVYVRVSTTLETVSINSGGEIGYTDTHTLSPLELVGQTVRNLRIGHGLSRA
jgi:hypothetical protein